MIIGQNKILKKLETYTLETLPKNLLFLGPIGSGRRTIIKTLSDRFDLDIVNITEKIDPEKIVEYQQSVSKKIYIIDLDEFTEKQQNQFLKLIEEPSINVYITLIAESENNILNTILNRCIKYKLEPYTKEQLQKISLFDSDKITDLVYAVASTPGSISNLDFSAIDSLYKLCKNIVDKINYASISNAVSISNKVNYKEDYNKYDFRTFFNMLRYCAFEKYMNEQSELSLKIYLFIVNHTKDLQIRTLNKENFMINFLISLKEMVK